MNELISLAKENAFVVIGLLLVALYLQDRIHGESLSTRQEIAELRLEMTAEFSGQFTGIRREMSAEFAAVRLEMSDFGERLARIETLVGQLLLEKRSP